MRHPWPKDTPFTRVVLEVEEEVCATCGRPLQVCDHRRHRIFTLQGPVELVCKLAHCCDRGCAAHAQTLSPYAETTFTLPWWLIGGDVFCWLGHRRFARHGSVPPLRAELADSYRIPLSADALEDSLGRYQIMRAARQQDAQVLAAAYRHRDGLVLSIDGLQPEKGHETLYVVRELNAKRVGFAEALLSSGAEEVRRLLTKAREGATQLGVPVQLGLSDKQDAFVTGIAAEFPDVPHRYGANHFLRDLAKPMRAVDSRAKVRMRSKVRGLRALERALLPQRHPPAAVAGTAPPAAAPGTAPPAVAVADVARANPSAGEVPAVAEPAEPGRGVLDYGSVVRGILNGDQGGPLQPSGLRRAEALGEVHASLQRNLDAQRGGGAHAPLQRLAGCIERGLAEVHAEQEEVRQPRHEVERVARTLDVTRASATQRQAQFESLQEEFAGKPTPFYGHRATILARFAVGRFAGGAALAFLQDNLDLERWFRLPKGHERRIHGHRHAGVRIVQEGPTLMRALDAHQAHPGPFTAEELRPYQDATPPPCQEEAIHRRKLMRKARSKKNEPSCCKNWNAGT